MSEPQSRPTSATDQTAKPAPAAWAAVISMTLGVFGLVTAEFLPVSLLTPMANELNVTEGLAGQAVSATAILALITSLLIATVTRRFDRRNVLLSFSVLLVISSIMVATAENFALLLAGRVLLGIGLGASGPCRLPPSCALFRRKAFRVPLLSCLAAFRPRPFCRTAWQLPW